MEYFINKIRMNDNLTHKKLVDLLSKEGIELDGNLDYTVGLFDEDYNLIGTGSCFENTLRCLAVSSQYQGEGFLSKIVDALIEYQFSKGNTHLFLYTKCDKSEFFKSLGFFEIARVEGKLIFMENRRNGFESFLQSLEIRNSESPKNAALVINANPFTLGHRYLVETACKENEIVNLFIVSDDSSVVPFSVRKQLVIDGTSDISNIVYHETGSYLISKSTFPSYFLKDSAVINSSHAALDSEIFAKISHRLGIKTRYVGDEPTSTVTNIYNQTMKELLPRRGVDVKIIPRKEINGQVISASTVRCALKEGNSELLKMMLPKTSLSYFSSEAGKQTIEKIKSTQDVKHY